MGGKLENLREYHRKWRAAHKEERRQSQATYRTKLKSTPEGNEKLRLQYKHHGETARKKNPEYRRLYNSKYQEAHKEEIRIKRQQKYKETKNRVLTYYGNGKCACVKCGFEDVRALSIDHINGGGEKQRKTIGWGAHIYLWLEKNKYPEGFQTLCMNCQFIKREDNKEYWLKSRDEDKHNGG